MPYEAPLTRVTPGCVLFLIDQSGSMMDRLEVGSKADAVADILNRVLYELIIKCTREDGVRQYCDIGVIGYGGRGPSNELAGSLGTQILRSISAIADNPLKIEDRTRRVPDGAGGLVEESIRFPIWVQPIADGGTPMCSALGVVAEEVVSWCQSHVDSFPPIVLHLTDGEATDGDPEPIAEQLREVETNDGKLLLFNVHVSGVSSRVVAFPAHEEELDDQYSRLLFRMSSLLVGDMLTQAQSEGYTVTEQSRGFMFNAKYEDIVKFMNIGTPQAQAMR